MKADHTLNADSVISYVFNESIDSLAVIACFDQLASTLLKETWVIIDNAPQHTGKIFKNKIAEWKEKNLHIDYLPPYSPELNLIEILWRFIKYPWVENTAFDNVQALTANIENILIQIGIKYNITFA